jgi:hypothetical protein
LSLSDSTELGPERVRRSGQAELQLAELLDRRAELVAGLEPDLPFLGIPGDDAFGRAREDQVARVEREVP